MVMVLHSRLQARSVSHLSSPPQADDTATASTLVSNSDLHRKFALYLFPGEGFLRSRTTYNLTSLPRSDTFIIAQRQAAKDDSSEIKCTQRTLGKSQKRRRTDSMQLRRYSTGRGRTVVAEPDKEGVEQLAGQQTLTGQDTFHCYSHRFDRRGR